MSLSHQKRSLDWQDHGDEVRCTCSTRWNFILWMIYARVFKYHISVSLQSGGHFNVLSPPPALLRSLGWAAKGSKLGNFSLGCFGKLWSKEQKNFGSPFFLSISAKETSILKYITRLIIGSFHVNWTNLHFFVADR